MARKDLWKPTLKQRSKPWTPTPEQLAQTSHFFTAATINAICHQLGGSLELGIFLVFLWALGKEFLFDVVVERDTMDGSCTDFMWYQIGSAVSLGWLLIVAKPLT